MRILVVVSSLDLRQPLSSTPSWWQLLKGLAEQGVDLVVAPYQGPALESPWWTAAGNPCQREGDLVGFVKRFAPPRTSPSRAADEWRTDRVTLALVERFTKPRWRRHLFGLLEQHRGIEALLFISVPPNHFTGIPRAVERKFGLPTFFYDGDAPASLPRFAGFRTGFRIYQGADLSEYAVVLSSSKGAVADLTALGARKVDVLYYAAEPAVFAGPAADEDIDIFFYGHGREYRERWIDAMLVQPSERLPRVRFAVRGTRLGTPARIAALPYASFNALKGYCRRSRINILITRQAHASVYASSTARPFELAAIGSAMVSNPYLGIEEWFEPGREVLIVHNADEAVATYRELLSDGAARRDLASRARERLLAEHTYAHRARYLRTLLSGEARETPHIVSAAASE